MNKMTTMFQEILKDSIGFVQAGENEKATIYAELAKAIAMTGTVCVIQEGTVAGEVEIKEVASEPKPNKVKEEPKSEPAKLEPVSKEKTEAKPEPTKTEETESPVAKHRESLNKYMELFGEDVVLQCLSDFSQNVLTELNDITDDNIEAFVQYLDLLMEATETA